MVVNDKSLINYNKEEAKLLSCFLDDQFFTDLEKNIFLKEFNSIETKNKNILDMYRIKKEVGLELIVRPTCTEKCEYCYLQKHKQELFNNVNIYDNEKILSNIDALLDFIFNKKQTYLQRIEIFAGDLFYDDLYFNIIEIIFKYYHQLYQSCQYLFENSRQNKKHFALVLTPTNITVLKDDAKIKKIKYWIEKFQEINVSLGYSFSTDGKYTKDTREKNAVKDQEELDLLLTKLQDFMIDIGGGVHPVLAPQAIDKWIENYDWWLNFFNELSIKDSSIKESYGFQPPILEVRDPEWTEESIAKYLNFLKHDVDKRLEMCNNDIDKLACHLFGDTKNSGILKANPQYDMIAPTTNSEYRMSCSFQSLLHIRASDLAIVPCHRLSYDPLIAGWFEQDENGKLTGNYIPHNVSTFIAMFTLNPNIAPKCVTCPIKDFCLKGCLGAQYEFSGEYLKPIPIICKLFLAKWNFLVDYWYQLGILESAKNQGFFNIENQNKKNQKFKNMANILLIQRGYDFQL